MHGGQVEVTGLFERMEDARETMHIHVLALRFEINQDCEVW